MLKECYRWISDNHEGTTPAVAYASENGDICIGEYKQFNNVNNSTQTRKKRTLKQSLRGQYLRVSVNNKSTNFREEDRISELRNRPTHRKEERDPRKYI